MGRPFEGQGANPISSLFGRERELARIADVLAAGRSSSQVLLVLGEAGLGKTALLGVAASKAEAAGARALIASGVEAEAELAFAGLHQLLRPVLDDVDLLPPRQAAALRCAFGLGKQATPERFLIGIATLSLLAEVAEQRPLLVIVDDAPWFDRESLEALAFAVRRLQAERIVVIVAGRTGQAVSLFGAEPQRMLLGPLNDAAANQLLDAASPTMPARLRARVKAEAAGNPLALIELATAPTEHRAAEAVEELPAAIAPTTRLARVFAERFGALPEPTRRILTVAAAEDGTDLRPVLRAATIMNLSPDALLPAEKAELVIVSGDEVRFRHPLIRTVINDAGPFEERRAAHLALAEAHDANPDRRAWHVAAATLTPDEAIAADLEATADRSRIRAGYDASARALERAARLSPEPSEEARRLVLAAEMAFAAGRSDWVEELTNKVTALTDDPDLLARAALTMAYVHALAEPGRAPVALSDSALEAAVRDAPATGVAILVVAAGFGLLTGDQELCATAQRLARSVPGPGDEVWRLYVLAASDPAGNAPQITPHVRRLVAEPPDDPSLLKLLAHIAWLIDQPGLAVTLLTRVVEDMRANGEVGGLTTFLVTLGFTEVWRGRWHDARALAAETVQIAHDIGQPAMVALGSALWSLVAALQGDVAVAHDRAAEADSISDAGLVAAVATWARGLKALADGRYEEANDHLQRMFSPGLTSAHFEVSRWAIGDFVEAATRAGVTDGLGRMVTDAQRLAEGGTSVRATLVLRRAKALLATDQEADALFRSAVSTPGAEDWPFELARSQLSFGEWLRRRRRIIEARPLLRAAQETFSRLGAKPWAERARAELRAAGVPIGIRPSDAVEELTAQQRQIAQLAARGLTNREIGAKLFLSPRTVSFHLHNVFVKLQVTSRSQLGHALGDSKGP